MRKTIKNFGNKVSLIASFVISFYPSVVLGLFSAFCHCAALATGSRWWLTLIAKHPVFSGFRGLLYDLVIIGLLLYPSIEGSALAVPVWGRVKPLSGRLLAYVDQQTRLVTGALISRNRGRGLVGYLAIVVSTIRGRINRFWVRELLVFSRFCYNMYRGNGLPFLVLYLKGCAVLTMQAVGRDVIPDSTPLGARIRRSRAGYPLVIPKEHRALIMKGDLLTLKAWLTIFSIYRVISFPGKLKLSTITDSATSVLSELQKLEADQFIQTFFSRKALLQFGDVKISDLSAKPYGIGKSGGTSVKGTLFTSTHPLMITFSGWLLSTWRPLEQVRNSFVAWLIATGNEALGELLDRISQEWNPTEDMVQGGSYSIGRLGLKEEASGKIRVFAMVDCWTQWIMKPLHDGLFSILSRIPTDGTFDQMAPVHRLRDKLQKVTYRVARVYSFDLSAATDRLPISLQVRLLEAILPLPGLASCWADILVKRDYLLSRRGEKSVNLRYAVGQPMGALSSWAMLALTHHFIVQWAYWRTLKVKWSYRFYDLYAVLGDDVVIAGPEVAKEYRFLMSSLGVNIGLAKSIKAKNLTFEFAKRFITPFGDATPYSHSELLSSRFSLAVAGEVARKYDFSFLQLATLLEYKFKSKGSLTKSIFDWSSRLRVLYIYLKYPKDSSSLEDFLRINSYGTLSKVDFSWGPVFEAMRLDYNRAINRVISLEEDYRKSMVLPSHKDCPDFLYEGLQPEGIRLSEPIYLRYAPITGDVVAPEAGYRKLCHMMFDAMLELDNIVHINRNAWARETRTVTDPEYSFGDMVRKASWTVLYPRWVRWSKSIWQGKLRVLSLVPAGPVFEWNSPDCQKLAFWLASESFPSEKMVMTQVRVSNDNEFLLGVAMPLLERRNKGELSPVLASSLRRPSSRKETSLVPLGKAWDCGRTQEYKEAFWALRDKRLLASEDKLVFSSVASLTDRNVLLSSGVTIHFSDSPALASEQSQDEGFVRTIWNRLRNQFRGVPESPVQTHVEFGAAIGSKGHQDDRVSSVVTKPPTREGGRIVLPKDFFDSWFPSSGRSAGGFWFCSPVTYVTPNTRCEDRKVLTRGQYTQKGESRGSEVGLDSFVPCSAHSNTWMESMKAHNDRVSGQTQTIEVLATERRASASSEAGDSSPETFGNINKSSDGNFHITQPINSIAPVGTYRNYWRVRYFPLWSPEMRTNWIRPDYFSHFCDEWARRKIRGFLFSIFIWPISVLAGLILNTGNDHVELVLPVDRVIRISGLPYHEEDYSDVLGGFLRYYESLPADVKVDWGEPSSLGALFGIGCFLMWLFYGRVDSTYFVDLPPTIERHISEYFEPVVTGLESSLYPKVDAIHVGCTYTAVKTWEAYPYFYDASRNITSFVWRWRNPAMNSWDWVVEPTVKVTDTLSSWLAYLPTYNVGQILIEGERMWPVLVTWYFQW